MIDKPGQRIRGKLDPFKSVLDPMLVNISTINGIELFREYLKDATALRMSYTLYPPISINNECMSVIKSYSKNYFNFSFIRCSLNYYCNRKPHKIEQLDTTGSSCKSKNPHKSLQHAKEDCLECSKHYIGKIKKQISICDDKNVINKCNAMENAISFVCRYIYALQEGKLPSILKKIAYENIEKKYIAIANFYSYDAVKDIYKLTVPKTLYKSFPLEIATEIFCSTFIFYNK